MPSEFDRIELAKRQFMSRPQPPAQDSVPASGDAQSAELPPVPTSEKPEATNVPFGENKTSGVPTPPVDHQALEAYFERFLGVRQALLLLEEKFPDAHKFATRGIDIRIDPTNTLFAKGDDWHSFTVIDLLRRAAGRDYETALEPIVEYFHRLSPEERECFRPDYQPGPDAIEDDESFPVEALPTVAREVVEHMVAIHGVPHELPATMVLVVGSAAHGNGSAVKSVQGLLTFPNICVIGAGPSGAGKSVVSKPIIKPLRDFEAHLKAQHKRLLPALTTRLAAVREQIAVARSGKAAAAVEADSTTRTEEELAAEEAVLLSKLGEPTLIVDDATSEALAKLAGENNGTIASISPDARSAIKNLIGKHSKGDSTDEDILLKGYSNEPIIQDRITRARVNTVACFTIGWQTQPDNMRLLFGKSTLVESGLLCRFLPFMFEGQRPPVTYEELEFPPVVSKAFHDRIWELAETYHQHRGEPHLISATLEARKALIDYDSRIRDLIAEGDLKWIETFAVRLGEQAWRIALVLHGLEHGKEAHHHSLQAHSATAAIKIVKWFFRQIEKLFGDMVDKTVDDKLGIARDFVERSPAGITARDLYRLKQGLFKDSADARSTLQSLAAEGAIRAGDASKNQRFYRRDRPKS